MSSKSHKLMQHCIRSSRPRAHALAMTVHLIHCFPQSHPATDASLANRVPLMILFLFLFNRL